MYITAIYWNGVILVFLKTRMLLVLHSHTHTHTPANKKQNKNRIEITLTYKRIYTTKWPAKQTLNTVQLKRLR